MEKKWKPIRQFAPPIGERFWAYEALEGRVVSAYWDGKNVNDDEYPFPDIPEVRGDDYNITYWMEMEKEPLPPNVDLGDF